MIYKTIEEWIEHNPNHIGALPIEVCHQIWGTKSKETSMTNEERKVMEQALEFIERINKDGWILADFEPQMYATITAIKEALAVPEQESVAMADYMALTEKYVATYIYASNLATSIWQKHYMAESPKFALLDTTEGVLTQIDNMTCGLVREKPVQPEQEPVCDKDPQGCWNVRCQLGNKCRNTSLQPKEPEQEPVAWLEPEWREKICPEVGYEATMTDDHPRDLCWIPLYAHPPQNTSETDEEIKAKCPRTDSIWSLGWYEGYKKCNKNTAQAYLKGFDEGCKSMSARNGDTAGRWSGKTKNIGSLGMPVNVLVTPPRRTWVGLTRMYLIKCGVLPFGMSYELCQAIEAKLKQKNGYAEEKNT